MVFDALTKVLPRPKHLKYRESMDLKAKISR